MMNLYPALRQRIKQAGVSWSEMASIADINPIVFHMKMWGIKRWTFTDAVKICGFFRTPDVEHLFVRDYNKQQFPESQGEIGNV